MLFSKNQALEGMHLMLQSRLFEQHIAKLFASGTMHGTTHLNMGQEACQAGLALVLEEGDWIVPTHRCHGYNIATGSSPFAMFSEMFGSSYGLCKGLGGSMHMSDSLHGNLGSSAVVASGVPLAAGLALAIQRQNKKNISVALFGDGASSRGAIHETMNMASIWNLPVLFYLENNGYGMSTASACSVATTNLIERSSNYCIKGEVVDGNDLEAVYSACLKARNYIIKNKKPYMIEVKTYRINGHSKSDPCVYRTREEEEKWEKKCPIISFKNKLIKEALIDEREFNKILDEDKVYIQKELDKAIVLKDDTLSLEEAKEFVFASSKLKKTPSQVSFHRAYGREAIREALLEEVLSDKNVLLLGEDIGIYGGCFKVTGDLHLKISNQILETPISEEGFSGIAIGASMLGLRPVVEIMYGDFSTLISDALINHASKIRFMSAGQFNCPVVFRLPMGCGTGHGSQHSQSLESLFTNIPGLKVVAPSSPRKAKALLKASIHDDNPVIFLEHKLLYKLNGEIGDSNDEMVLAKADIERLGTEISLISYGYSTQVCREAINELVLLDNDYKGKIELIDLCTLKPLDEQTIVSSVMKTKKALIVHESPKIAGFGSEILYRIMKDERLFNKLDKPIRILGGKEIPIPFSPELEKIVIPTKNEIIENLKEMLK